MAGDPFVHLLCLLASLLIEKIRKEKKMATLLHFLRGTPWSELKQCFYTGSIDRRRMGIKGVPCAVRCCCSLWDCEWKHISHNAIFTTNLLNASRVEYRTQDLADIRLAHYEGDTRMGKLMKSYEITCPANNRLRLQRMMPFEYFSSPIYFKLPIGYCRYVGRTIEYSDSIDTIQQWNSKYMYCEANTINPECLIVELGVGCATSNKYNWRIFTKNNFFQLPHQWYVIGRGEVNLETKRI